MVYTTKSIVRSTLTRCNKRRMEVTLPDLQRILYFVQNQFVLRCGDTCFKEPFFVWEEGPYLESLLDWCDDSTVIPYRRFMTRCRTDPKMEKEDIQIVYEVVDIISGIPKDAMLAIIKRQKPFKKAFKRDSREVLIEDLQEFFKVDG